MDNITTKIVELLSGVYVIPGATNVGVITEEKEDKVNVYLIDSGCTELDGDYILEVLNTFFNQSHKQFKIISIINTHSHADHIGANTLLKNETNCEIWMPEREITCAINPLFQTAIMWGAYPPHELRTVFFNSGEMDVDRTFNESLKVELFNGDYISAIDLHGHSFQNMGIIYNSNTTGKKVLFSGDALFPREQLANHWIPFMVHPENFLLSLDTLESSSPYEWVIPSHGDFIKRNLKETIELNKIAIISNKKMLLSILKDGKKTTEEIVQKVAELEEIKLSVSLYGLITSTIKSYLSLMHDAQDIRIKIENNILYWYLP